MYRICYLLDLLDIFDLLWILETYLLQNGLIRQRKLKGGGHFENRGFSGKSNYKVEFLLKTWCFPPVCAVILLLALCWKHDLKTPFLTKTYVLMFGYGIEKKLEIQRCIRRIECIRSIGCTWSIGSIGSIVYTGNIPPVKWIN